MFSRGRIHGLSACAVIFAMLAIAVAPLWHSHVQDSGGGQASTCRHGHTHDGPDQPRKDHQDRGEHTDCAVCIAIHAPVGSGLPRPDVVLPFRTWIGLVAAVPGDEPAVRFLPVLWPCGPPRLMA